MVLSLFGLIEVGVLFLNAIAILHEERFLTRFGWGKKQPASMVYSQPFGAPQETGETKTKLWEMFHSIRTVARGNQKYISCVKLNGYQLIIC